MDTGAVKGTGLSAKFEKFVKSSVQSALNKELTFRLSSVGDIRYDAGKLEFFDNAGKRMASFGGSGSDSTAHQGMFSQSDSQALIVVFRAKKAKALGAAPPAPLRRP